jgi:hypothetical protein
VTGDLSLSELNFDPNYLLSQNSQTSVSEESKQSVISERSILAESGKNIGASLEFSMSSSTYF